MLQKVRWSGWLFCFLILISAVSQAAESSEPIVIGATVSMEGKYQEPSLMIQKAFKLWVEQVNQGNGLLGRPVKLILYDDKSNTELTRTLYKRLIEEDKVDIVFSPYSTPLTLVASEISEQHQMIMLAIAAASEKPWQRGGRYLFQLYAPAIRQFIGLLDMMAKKNKKKLAVLYDNGSPFNIDIVDGVRQWSRIFKLDIVYDRPFGDGKQELPGLLAEIRDQKPQGLILSAYPPDCYELLRLLGEMRYKPGILAAPIAPAHPDFHKNAGDMANHILGPSQWEPNERIPFPGTRRFIEEFNGFTGHMPSFHAASAYAACQLYERAITHTKSLDSRKLRDHIAALDTATVLGRFKVDPTGKQVGHNSIIIQWQNGKKEIVWPPKMRSAPPVF